MSKSKPKRKRPVAIGIRASRPEASIIRRTARELGISVGAFCREAALDRVATVQARSAS